MEPIKVLIVEDEEPIRELIAMNVEMLGYVPLRASTGSQGLKLFFSENPDVVLLDLMLPDMEGYDVCREIRMKDEKVPIIFISARTDDFDKIIALELGADDYITKPFNPRELQAKLKNWVRRARSETSSKPDPGWQYFLNDLRIDVVSGVVLNERTGEESRLTRGQAKILEYLLRNPDRIISFEELAEVFSEFTIDTIKKYLSYLRKIVGSGTLFILKGKGVILRRK